MSFQTISIGGFFGIFIKLVISLQQCCNTCRFNNVLAIMQQRHWVVCISGDVPQRNCIDFRL